MTTQVKLKPYISEFAYLVLGMWDHIFEHIQSLFNLSSRFSEPSKSLLPEILGQVGISF